MISSKNYPSHTHINNCLPPVLRGVIQVRCSFHSSSHSSFQFVMYVMTSIYEFPHTHHNIDVTDDASREYPGNRPFAEPGVSISNVGPCGMETYDTLMTNWNMPQHSWGAVQETYNAGDVITVEWCVSNIADHGGVYSYRLCQNDDIVSNFINPNYTPNETDYALLETCFQEGILKCSDVEGNQDCSSPHPDCVGTGWGCEDASDWFACGPKDTGRCEMKSNGEYCYTHGNDGSILSDQVKLPDNFTSNHTLLGFRWDCEDTGQLWLHCADIQIV